MTPWEITKALAAEPSRKAKEAIVEAAVSDTDAATFFSGAYLCYDSMSTFGVKQVPEKLIQGGQGFPWKAFIELADSLKNRELTGHDARDAIQLAMDCATQDQWNFWYRPILIKDLRCGLTETTINTVVKRCKRDDLIIPVFSAQLAHDGVDHPKKCGGKKMIEVKLDGSRILSIVYPSGQVDQFSRNGKELVNFDNIKKQLAKTSADLSEPMVFDGEIMSSSFQDLMKQMHRKSNVMTDDAILYLFDIIPLTDFNSGICKTKQTDRTEMLKEWKTEWTDVTPNISTLDHEIVDLDTASGKERFKEINLKAIEINPETGKPRYEGIMLKNLDAPYQCKRTHDWLKIKPTITVDLSIVGVEEGTGKYSGKLGALICEGEDTGRLIMVNVGSGLTDKQREEFWNSKNELFGKIVEVEADGITQNQDGTYSLRFPRFLRFRGFEIGEKI
jgi:DNA ligase-1